MFKYRHANQWLWPWRVCYCQCYCTSIWKEPCTTSLYSSRYERPLKNCLKKVIYIPFRPAQTSVEESLLKEQRRYNFFVDVRCVIQEVCKCAVTIVIRNSTQSMSISTKATMSPHNTHVQNAKNNWHNNKYHIIPKSINRRMEHIEVFIFFIVMLSKFWTVAALLFQV